MSVPLGHEQPSADEIRTELARVLESAEFVASRQLARFLSYIINESLAGRADSIKQRNVAVHALDRDASYRPRTDPIVRIVAGKLRRALERYYDGVLAGSSVRIEVPKGAYRPRFTKVDTRRSDLSTLSTSAGFVPPADGDRTQRPSLAVVPFVAFSRGAYERHVADSIAQDICVQLSRFSWFEVTDFLTAQGLSHTTPAPIEIASHLHADYFLAGTIRKQEGLLRITVQLADTASGRIIWAERFTLDGSEQGLREQDSVVERVAARIGDLYGVMATAVLSQARRKPREQRTLCEAVLANLRYQSHLADGLFANAFQNVERALSADPEFAWGWAALGLLHVDNFVLDIDHHAAGAAEHALFCVRQALKADAECGLAHFTQGVYHLAHGEIEQCIAAAERTVEFAHGSPFEAAGAGALLAMVGEDEASQSLIGSAVHNNPGLPGWVQWASAVNHLKRGESQQASLATQRFSLPECFWDHLFRAAAQIVAGDDQQAKASMTRAQQLRPTLTEQRRDLVSRLVQQPELQSIVVEELPWS